MSKIINTPGMYIPDPDDIPKIVELADRFITAAGRIIKGIGNVLKDLFAPDEEINNKKVYNEKTSSASDIEELHDLLGNYRTESKNAGKIILADIKEECNAFFDKTLDQFERYSKSFGMQHMSGTYKKRFSRMIDDLDSIFDDCINKNLSMDNAECLSILKMMPGDSKITKMTEFRKSVFQTAIDNICKQIRLVMDEFFDTIDSTFTNKLDSMEHSIAKSTEALEKLCAEGEQNTMEKEQIQLVSYRVCAISDHVLFLTGGEQ